MIYKVKKYFYIYFHGKLVLIWGFWSLFIDLCQVSVKLRFLFMYLFFG